LHILPYRTLDNVIDGAVITFVDITGAKKAREALRLNEERTRVALNASPVVVYNQDRDLRYIWIYNPHLKLFVDQILGKTDADLLPAEEAANMTAFKRRVLESGAGTRQEVRTIIAGKPCFYDLTVEPLHDAAGGIIGITCASIDITDRRPQDRAGQGAKEKQPENDGGVQ